MGVVLCGLFRGMLGVQTIAHMQFADIHFGGLGLWFRI